jgi:hypothetical protein
MGVLTHDLSRLRNEILALRSARQALIHDLERETGDRRTDVSQMLADFPHGLGAVTRTTRAHCLGSISNLKRKVTDLRTDLRTDLSGIRQTWLGLGAPLSRLVEKLEDQADVEAGANAEGKPSETGSKRSRDLVEGQKPLRRKRKS